MPPELYSIFEPESGRVFIDAGGDDAGVTALGGLHTLLNEAGYEMLYVINRYRVLSQTPEEAAELLQEIQTASRLKATALVNNSHLGVETEAGYVDFRPGLCGKDFPGYRTAPVVFHRSGFCFGAGGDASRRIPHRQTVCEIHVGVTKR